MSPFSLATRYSECLSSALKPACGVAVAEFFSSLLQRLAIPGQTGCECELVLAQNPVYKGTSMRSLVNALGESWKGEDRASTEPLLLTIAPHCIKRLGIRIVHSSDRHFSRTWLKSRNICEICEFLWNKMRNPEWFLTLGWQSHKGHVEHDIFFSQKPLYGCTGMCLDRQALQF